MSLSVKKKIKLDAFQLYTFVYKFQNLLTKKFPQSQMIFDESNSIVCTNTEETNEQVQKQIKAWVGDHRVEVIGVRSGTTTKTKEFQEIEEKYDSLVFGENQVKKQFQELEERALERVNIKIQGKMESNEESIVVIVKKKYLDEVKNLIELSQKNNRPKNYEIDLQLNSKKILTAELIGLLVFDQSKIKLVNKEDTLFVQGPIKLCKAFKQAIDTHLSKIKILINYVDDISCIKRIKKFKFKYDVSVFSNQEVSEVCNKLKELYDLDGPLQVFQKVSQSQQFFVIVTCPPQHAEEVKTILDEASQAPQPKQQKPKKYRQRKDQKKKVKQIQIPLDYFKQNDLKQFCIESNILQYVNDIRITKNKVSKLAYVELNCFESSSVKKCQIFDQYFNFAKYCFMKQVKQKMVRQVISKLTEDISQKWLAVQYVSGYSPYAYYQINKNIDYQNQLISNISNNKISQSSENQNQFYCFILKGLRSLILQKSQQLDSTIKNTYRIATQDQQWSIKIHKKLIQYIPNKKVQQYLQSEIKSTFDRISKSISLDSIKIDNESITCQISIVNPQLQQAQTRKIKSQFQSLFDTLTLQPIRQKHITIKKLYEIIPSGLFVQNQDSNIMMIGFKQFHQNYSLLKQTLQSHSKQSSIKYPIHLLDFLQSNLTNLKCEIKFIQDPFDSRIKIEGYNWSIEQDIKTIEDLIRLGEEQSAFIHFTVNAEVLDKLRQKQILKKLADSNKIRLQIKQANYSKFRLKYMNGNRVYINQIPIPQNRSSSYFRTFFDEQEFGKYLGDNKTVNKHGIKMDNESKIVFIKSIYQIEVLNQLIKQKLMLFLNTGQQKLLDEIIQKYGCVEKLKPLIIYTSLSIKSYLQNKQKQKNVVEQIIQFGWIQNGSQNPYPPKAQALIKQQESKGAKFVILNEQDLDIVQNSFTINKSKLTIKSLKTKKQFDILHDKANKRFSMKINDSEVEILQNQYDTIINHPVSEMQVVFALYKLDLQLMTQTNLLTDYGRKAYRKTHKNEQKIEYILDNFKNSNSQIIFSIHRDSQNILQAIKQQLDQQISSLNEGQIDLSINLKVMSITQLIDLCEQKNIDVVINKQTEESVMTTLKSHDLRIVKQIVHDYKIRQSQNMIIKVSEKVEYPHHWIEQQELIVKIQVPKNTDEFLKISDDFRIAPIKKLFRIQNQYLWKKYYQQKKDLQHLTQKQVKQLYLFHGTRTYNPENIYLDKQESFNINFSSDNNFFGRGIYFAKHAQYSHDYCHKVSSFVKQMLYCKVMVGESQVLIDKDRSKEIKDTGYRNLQKKIKYESITSSYGGTDVFIIYKSRRAYPQYLIQY